MVINNISLNKHTILLTKLSVKITNGVKAPHKAIMLISIANLIGKGVISKNRIPLSQEIADTFSKCWDELISNNQKFEMFSKNPWTPFWHMKKEPFWHFEPINNRKEVESLVPTGQTASIGKMRSAIKYAFLDQELYDLFADEITRRIIIDFIKDEYILP